MTCQDLILELEQGVRLIKFNRPNKKNALSLKTLALLTNTLTKDAEDNNVVISIITGAGDYFSSGIDVSIDDFLQSDLDIEQLLESRLGDAKKFTEAFINYPKVLIAVVNGPAIGIATTITAMCDIVYASPRTTFELPYIRLGLSMVGCSSYHFPAMLGKSKTSEMVFLNHILTADEGYKLGFISKIIPHEELNDFIKGLYKYGSLSVDSIKRNKRLMSGHHSKILNDCIETELKEIKKCSMSEDFLNAMMDFSNKSKL